MTDQELKPFLGKPVAVTLTTGQTVTGTLGRADATAPYSVASVDDEVPPVSLRPDQIESVEG